jgi:hypothetical protein
LERDDPSRGCPTPNGLYTGDTNFNLLTGLVGVTICQCLLSTVKWQTALLCNFPGVRSGLTGILVGSYLKFGCHQAYSSVRRFDELLADLKGKLDYRQEVAYTIAKAHYNHQVSVINPTGNRLREP